MKRCFTIYWGILITSLGISGLAQQPATRDQDKSKSGGTVEADRDRAGKTGQIGDGDRSAPGKTRYVGYDLFGAFQHLQLDLDQDGRISRNEYEQAFNRLDADHDGYLSAEELRQAELRSMKSGDEASSNRGGRSSAPSRKSDTTKLKDTR
jgi:hypothetical protein